MVYIDLLLLASFLIMYNNTTTSNFFYFFSLPAEMTLRRAVFSPVVLPSNASLHLFSCFSKLAPSLCETSFNRTPKRCLLTSDTTRASNPLFARSFCTWVSSNCASGLVNCCVPYQSKVDAPNVEAMKVRKRGVESLVDRTMVRQRGEASQMNDIFEQIT